MIRLAIEICSGASSFRAVVWAESIEQALKLVEARHPGGEAKVIFPIEPEAYFVAGPVTAAEAVRLETPEEIAG